MSDPFRYIFRFCCDPGFNDEAEMQALKRYVREARIDDVAVFANVQELNTGHMTREEQDVYLRLMERVRDLLSGMGVTFSVNHWHSVMHADLGKRMDPALDFRPMVDVEGNEAALCVCPLCEKWQRHIAGLYARYAQLEPSILWVEDDFRLHNHAPLVWGGCFCEEHMRLYSERAGKALTREEFLRGVLRPGPPHPYRKIWLDVSRETMLSAARAIGQAVRQASATARVGLMSSVPHVHAAEGRDWHALLRALAAGLPPVDRIHLPGYQEQAPGAYLAGLNRVALLNRAFLPRETEVYPELENFPYSLFSKSRRFTRFQLLSALVLNLAGITIDLYDLNGNGIVWEDGYQDMLREVKPFLNRLTALGVFAGERRGVHVLCSPDSSYTLHITRGASMEELYPRETFFAQLLPALGIPAAYCLSPDLSGQVVAASGQVLRNWSAETLNRLFARNFVILDGDALWTLLDMGLGHLAGVESARWLTQDSGACAYEQAEEGHVYAGRTGARASAMIFCSDVLDVRYLPDARVEGYTAFYDSFRRRAAHGQTVVNGRVMIYPFGHFGMGVPPMLLGRVRQEILQDVLDAAGFDVPMVRGLAYLAPYCFRNGDTTALYLINASSDPAEDVVLSRLPGGGVRALRSEGAREHMLAPRPAKGGAALGLGVGSLETALILFDDTQGS